MFQLACFIVRGSANDWYFFPILVVSMGVSVAARYWRFVLQWLNGIRGRDWARISAVIDVVSVVKQTEQRRGGEYVVGYLATLTYFYRNPELQMGEYSRLLDEEDDANSWAESYKGRTVMVNVDPRNPANSVLRKEEL